jgi:hypothetical protein
MKLFKISFLAGLAAMLVMGLTGSAFAFHDGGVAVCEGCHSMHNSLGGTNNTVAGSTNSGQSTLSDAGGTASTITQSNTPYLLKGSDQSSTCLNCHGSASQGSYHELTTGLTAGGVPVNYTPGGDFGWLVAIQPSLNTSNPWQSNGHHIVAADFGLLASTMSTAPGGTYPSDDLACSSCHDPHGRFRQNAEGVVSGPSTPGATLDPIASSGSYPVSTKYPLAVDGSFATGVYRLLGGSGYLPKSLDGTAAQPFVNPSPIAVAPATYNQNEETSGEVRVAYGEGMSEWCANCHPGMLNSGDTSSTHRHPNGAGATMDGLAGDVVGSGGGTFTIADNYNTYLGSGNMGGANQYTSLIPIEMNGGATRATLSTKASNNLAVNASDTNNLIASTTTSVMCLSCHRAHASAFQQMGRWDFNDELIVNNGAYPTTIDPYGVKIPMAAGQYQAGMYGRAASDFALYQRQLCNKCHAKD